MGKEQLVSVMNRRVRLLSITPEFILRLLKVSPGGELVGGSLLTVTDDAIPMDAKAVGATIGGSGVIQIAIESSEFDVIDHCDPAPIINPQYSLVRR